MILVPGDKLESLTSILKNDWFPRPNGKPMSVATLSLWATRGVRGVVLETVSIGQCVCTSKDRVDRFFAALTEAKRRRDSTNRNAPPESSERGTRLKGAVKRRESTTNRRVAKASHRA